MSDKLRRPSFTLGSSLGLLRAEHFQMAYLTTDIVQAKALFDDRLGISNFTDLEGEMPDGGYIKAAFAWVGTIMYELIETTGTKISVYAQWLPAENGFHIRHHHLGYLVHDRAQFDAIQVAAETNGWGVAHVNSNPLVDVCFIYVPELGHYLEYLLPTEMGLTFFDSIQRN